MKSERIIAKFKTKEKANKIHFLHCSATVFSGGVATVCGGVATMCGVVATVCGGVATVCGVVATVCGVVATVCGVVATVCGVFAKSARLRCGNVGQLLQRPRLLVQLRGGEGGGRERKYGVL